MPELSQEKVQVAKPAVAVKKIEKPKKVSGKKQIAQISRSKNKIVSIDISTPFWLDFDLIGNQFN